MIQRQNKPHVILFPSLATQYITPSERDLLANCKAIRALFEKMVDARRNLIKSDPEAAEKKGDLLSILLSDDLFSLDNNMIVDECLTFFFAGSQTSSVTTQNLILHLIKNRKYGDQIINEIEKVVVIPFKEQSNDTSQVWEPTKFLDMIDYEMMSELTFYGYCFNESLRMQPPVYFSSSVCMMEDLDIGGFKIRKGDAFSIDMYRLGNNPKEWKEPSRFYPERFDHNSEYFKTPAGKNRNPYSFSPFLGGQRVCIGKTLVETISKLTLPTLWTNFDMELENV